MKNVLISLLIFLLACPVVRADPSPDQKHVASIKQKVAKCVYQQKRVVIETYDGKRFQGYISETGPDNFVLSRFNQATTLSYQDVRKIGWQSPLWNQAKIIAGAAAITGAIFSFVVLLGGLKG